METFGRMIDHKVLTMQVISKAKLVTAQLWKEEYGEDYEVSFDQIMKDDSLFIDLLPKSMVSVEEILKDREWLRISSIDFKKDVTILPRALLAYQKFMFLSAKYPNPEESPGPTHVIDLIWHTHMQHPVAYIDYCEKLFGRVLDHDPWPTFSLTQYKSNVLVDDQHWYEEFKEKQWNFGQNNQA